MSWESRISTARSFWTIQPLAVWRALEREGELSVSLPADSIPERYPWLAAQLRRRVPDGDGSLTWWYYCRKPDLRTFRHRRRGRQVRLELAIPAERVVAFPCWAWNVVYCGGYLARDARDARRWDRDLRAAFPDEDDEPWPLPEPFRRRLEASWEMLFDPSLPGRPWKGFDGIRLSGREAVTGTLRLDEVREVTRFEGTRRRAGDSRTDVRRRRPSSSSVVRRPSLSTVDC